MTNTGKYHLREIDERWNEQILSIIDQSPVEANGLCLLFDRRPDLFFVLRQRSRSMKCIGFFRDDELLGFAVMLEREVMVDGKSCHVRYFGFLVLHPAARGKNFLYRLSDDLFSEHSGRKKYGYSLIMQGNRAALSILNRFHPAYPNMPYSKMIGLWQVRNILLIFKVFRKPSHAVRKATLADIPAIVNLLQQEYKQRLFAPEADEHSLLRDLEAMPGLTIENYYVAESQNEMVGVCCAWNMEKIKRYRVIAYGSRLRWIRYLANTASSFIGYPGLPAEGGTLRVATVTDFAVKGRDPAVLRSLLQRIHKDYRQKKFHLLILGLAHDDPMNRACKGFISLSLISQIHVFSPSEQTVQKFDPKMYPYIDMTLI